MPTKTSPRGQPDPAYTLRGESTCPSAGSAGTQYQREGPGRRLKRKGTKASSKSDKVPFLVLFCSLVYDDRQLLDHAMRPQIRSGICTAPPYHGQYHTENLRRVRLGFAVCREIPTNDDKIVHFSVGSGLSGQNLFLKIRCCRTQTRCLRGAPRCRSAGESDNTSTGTQMSPYLVDTSPHTQIYIYIYHTRGGTLLSQAPHIK